MTLCLNTGFCVFVCYVGIPFPADILRKACSSVRQSAFFTILDGHNGRKFQRAHYQCAEWFPLYREVDAILYPGS